MGNSFIGIIWASVISVLLVVDLWTLAAHEEESIKRVKITIEYLLYEENRSFTSKITSENYDKPSPSCQIVTHRI